MPGPKIDWNSRPQVEAYARRMGKGMTVIQHAGRRNFNITHTERRDRWDVPGVTVILHT